MGRYPVVDRYPVGINSVFEAWDALDIVMAGHVLVRRIVKDHNGRLEFNMPGRPLHREYWLSVEVYLRPSRIFISWIKFVDYIRAIHGRGENKPCQAKLIRTRNDSYFDLTCGC